MLFHSYINGQGCPFFIGSLIFPDGKCGSRAFFCFFSLAAQRKEDPWHFLSENVIIAKNRIEKFIFTHESILYY